MVSLSTPSFLLLRIWLFFHSFLRSRSVSHSCLVIPLNFLVLTLPHPPPLTCFPQTPLTLFLSLLSFLPFTPPPFILFSFISSTSPAFFPLPFITTYVHPFFFISLLLSFRPSSYLPSSPPLPSFRYHPPNPKAPRMKKKIKPVREKS